MPEVGDPFEPLYIHSVREAGTPVKDVDAVSRIPRLKSKGGLVDFTKLWVALAC